MRRASGKGGPKPAARGVSRGRREGGSRVDRLGRDRQPAHRLECDRGGGIVHPPALQPDSDVPATLIGTEREKGRLRIVFGRVHRMRRLCGHHLTPSLVLEHRTQKWTPLLGSIRCSLFEAAHRSVRKTGSTFPHDARIGPKVDSTFGIHPMLPFCKQRIV